MCLGAAPHTRVGPSTPAPGLGQRALDCVRLWGGTEAAECYLPASPGLGAAAPLPPTSGHAWAGPPSPNAQPPLPVLQTEKQPALGGQRVWS